MQIWPVDITSRVKALQQELRANLYFSEEKGKIIVAPMFEVVGGGYREQVNPVILSFDTSPESIAHQAKTALLAYKRGGKPWNRNHEPIWPAYQASKLKSRKEFELHYLQMSLETINTVFRVEANETAVEGIFVGAWLAQAADDLVFGETLLWIYRCCQQMARVDFVV